jgi:hypothetical protein
MFACLIPIFNGGLGFIFAKGITSTIYLRSWALGAIVIVFRFLLDSFFLIIGSDRMNNLGSLSFHNHLRLAHELLPLMVVACVPPFEHLANKRAN